MLYFFLAIFRFDFRKSIRQIGHRRLLLGIGTDDRRLTNCDFNLILRVDQ